MLTRKKPALSFSDEGRQLIKLLQKAAGVEWHRVKAIECRVAINECVTFKVELIGDADDLKEALCFDVSNVDDAIVEMIHVPVVPSDTRRNRMAQGNAAGEVAVSGIQEGG